MFQPIRLLKTLLTRNYATASQGRQIKISVEGNIGVGKTKLLNYFSQFSDHEPIEEPIRRWRNIRGQFNALSLLYEDPKKWSFLFQSYVQLTMLQNHLKDTNKEVVMLERSLFSARYIFVENLSRSGMLNDLEVAVLDEWFEEIRCACPLDLIVYLRCSPEVCHHRVHKRGRPEEAGLTLDMLTSLNHLHESCLCSPSPLVEVPARVLVLNGNLPCDEMVDEYAKVKEAISLIRKNKGFNCVVNS